MTSLRNTLIALAGAGLAASGAEIAAQDRPLTAGLTDVYRVGGLAAPEWAQFVRPIQMGFDGAGNLYVLDPEAGRVVVIDAGGDLVRTVGRKGEGPGEFQIPSDLVVWRDGRFAVADQGHGAYQLFGRDGQLERFVRMSTASGQAGMAAARKAVRADPAGGAVIAEGAGMGAILFSVFAEEFEGETVDVTGEDGKLERLDLSGEVAVAESIARARLIAPETMDVEAPYFAPVVVWDVLPNGTIGYFDSTAYQINLVGADGGSKGVLERPVRPEAVTGRIRSAVIEHLLGELEERLEEAMGQMEELLGRRRWKRCRKCWRSSRKKSGTRNSTPRSRCCAGCGPPGAAPSGCSGGAKIHGMTWVPSMSWDRTARTWGPCPRGNPGCRSRSGPTVWLRSWSGTSWMWFRSWSGDCPTRYVRTRTRGPLQPGDEDQQPGMMDVSPVLPVRARPRVRFGTAAFAGIAGWAVTAGPVAAQDRPLAADFEEVWRVGGLDAPTWAQFSDGALPIGFDAAGNLHVLDPDASQVVVVDSRGELVRTVGRKGEGPGEFIRPIELGVWRDGRFVVMDPGHQAFQIFGPDGELERFVKTGREPIFVRFLATRVDPREDAMIVQGPPPNPARRAIAESVAGSRPDGRADDRGLERLKLRGDVMAVEPVLRAWRIQRMTTNGPDPRSSGTRVPRISPGWHRRSRGLGGTSNRNCSGMSCPTAPSPTPTPRPTSSSLRRRTLRSSMRSGARYLPNP